MITSVSMLGSWLKSIVGLTSIIVAPWFANAPIDQDPGTSDVQYTCQPLVWVKEPVLVKGLMDAELLANCEFTAIGQGGFSQLKAYFEDKIQKESSQVHSGPVSITYKGMPADQYDVSVELAGGKDSVSSRQDVFLATDLQTRLIMDAKSTKIDGSGYGKYLKKINASSQIDSTRVVHYYTAVVGASFQLEKPFIVPGGVFKDMVKKEIEKQFVEQQKNVIEELAKHI